MASKLPDLRIHVECAACIFSQKSNPDFLFDPNFSIAITRLSKVTFGAHRHHRHNHDLLYSQFRNFFEVYQTAERGFLTIVETVAYANVGGAVSAALWLLNFPTKRELALYGL